MATEKNVKRKKVSTEKKDKFFILGVIVLSIVFIFVIYKIYSIIVQNNEQIDLSGNTYYQYFMGIPQEYSGKIKVINNDNGKKLVLEDKREVYLDSTPIYYKDVLGKVILPEKMALILPNDKKTYKLDTFTNIIEDSKIMYVKKMKKDKTTALDPAFLYDGNDLYFFLEETTIKIGKQKFKVSPLSYAIVNYRQNVEIYNYEKDEYTIVEEKLATSNKDVLAVSSNNDYTINMSVDSYSTGLTDVLLIKGIDNLNKFDY